MKLRCTSNSIRLRLRKSDLQALSSTEKIEELIAFPNGIELRYELRINVNTSIQAIFEHNIISIRIPREQAIDWIKSSEVSLEAKLKLEGSEELHILIEKDFPCKDREEENKEDTFWELSPDNNSC